MQVQPTAISTGNRGSITLTSDGTSEIAFGNSSSVMIENGRGFHAASYFYPNDGYQAFALGKNSTLGKWSVVYANSGSINTSDKNYKSNIRELSEAEKRVAQKLKSLVRIYQTNEAIEKKGEDDARLHCGMIAQDVKIAFEEEGLDGFRYGLLCSDTWWDGEDEDGNIVSESVPVDGYEKKTQLSIRYSELLAFIISTL